MRKLFLCVGAAKTGTTWLYRNLQRNPELWFTPEKELHYFFSRFGWFNRIGPRKRAAKIAKFEAFARENLSPQAYEKRSAWFRKYGEGRISDEWYRRLFEDMPDDCWACDFSPSTSLISPDGWRSVAGFAPEVKIVYIMREPRERLWSHAKFHASFTGKAEAFGEMGLDEINRFIRKASLTRDGDYGTHLERIYNAIPRADVHVIDYSRIAPEPMAVLREVEAFLGVGETPAPKTGVSERVNTSAPLPMPEGFGAPFRDEFRREARLLVSLGVDFAKPWRDAYTRPLDGVRDQAWKVARAIRA